VLTLDQIQTVAFAGLFLFVGYGILRVVPLLARYNIPAPVVGGLLIATFITASRAYGWTPITFTPTLQSPLMIAFFTTIGFGASLSLLRVGGPAVVLFFVLSSLMAVMQNVLGVGVAYALGQHPLMGVLAGSVTLTGGPATGLAFAPLFESAGVPGAATLAVAAAMAGIVAGGLVGGPVATWLLKGLGRQPRSARPVAAQARAEHVVEGQSREPAPAAPAGEDVEAYGLLKGLVLILAAMWAGSWVSTWFSTVDLNGNGQPDVTLPAYIGAMLVAAVLRNLDDATKLVGVSQRTIDDLGATALSLFLVMALMTLKLWDLVGVATPLAIMLIVQVVAIMVVAGIVVFRLMGRDYEAAVMSGGFCGFMLGTTANAMANMEALVRRYGPAPKAFLVVPMVGAFFVDFTNAIIITFCLNIFR
jgi:ESS family glutamate:Na+ symporter